MNRYLITPISRADATALVQGDTWMCVGENTNPGFTYWNMTTGELIENAESDSPVYYKLVA